MQPLCTSPSHRTPHGSKSHIVQKSCCPGRKAPGKQWQRGTGLSESAWERQDSGDKPTASLPVPTSSSWRKVPVAPGPAPLVVPARAGSAPLDRLLASPHMTHGNAHPVPASTWSTASFSGAEQGACRHPTPARSNSHYQAAVLCSPQLHSHVGTAQTEISAQPSWGRTGIQHS